MGSFKGGREKPKISLSSTRARRIPKMVNFYNSYNNNNQEKGRGDRLNDQIQSQGGEGSIERSQI